MVPGGKAGRGRWSPTAEEDKRRGMAARGEGGKWEREEEKEGDLPLEKIEWGEKRCPRDGKKAGTEGWRSDIGEDKQRGMAEGGERRGREKSDIRKHKIWRRSLLVWDGKYRAIRVRDGMD